MRLSHVGLVIGILALTAAVMSPWAITAISPPSPTLEESVADFAAKLTEAAKAKVTGETYVPAPTPEPSPIVGLYMPAVIALGMVAFALGVVAMLRESDRFPGALAAGIGVTAVVAQWSIFIALVVIGLLLLMKVLDKVDVITGLFD
ncbi:MAG: hypothetical protein AAGA11_17340 [Pseudomonadota bacterium]